MLSLLKYQHLMLAGLCISTTAIAADQPKAYVQLNVGAAFAPSFLRIQPTIANNLNTYTYGETYNPGFTAGIALGYRIADPLRLEGEVLYQSNDGNKYQSLFSANPIFNVFGYLKGTRDRVAFLLNAYYDFKNTTAFTPYITAGMGGYHLQINNQYYSTEHSLDFAWQAGAGLNYSLNDRISLDLKYRYLGGSDAELRNSRLSSSYLYNVGDHQIVAGLRIGF